MIRLCSRKWFNEHNCTTDHNYSIDCDDNFGLKVLSDLQPSRGLIEFYKLNPTRFDLFAEGYNRELESAEVQKTLIFIEYCWKKNISVNLVCSCDDYRNCHRYLISQMLLNRGVSCQCI